MVRSKWTGCSRGSLSAGVLILCVLSGWNTQGFVQSCSDSPAISFQWGEQADLRAHTNVANLQLSFFPCWFSFSDGCTKIKIPLCYMLAYAYGPQVACHLNKQNDYPVGEMLLFLLLLVSNNGKSGTKKTKCFFPVAAQWDCDRARNWVQVSWVPAQTFKHQNILLLVNSECFGKSFPRVFHN